MSTDTHAHLLDELHILLEKQIELVRKSDLRSFEALTEQAGSIVDEIVGTKAFEHTEFNEQRERIAKLYRELILMVEAQKYHINKRMRRINEGRKMLGAYRNNV